VTDPIRISHSDIAQWLRCRRLFDWQYRKEFMTDERLWGPRACGFRVHLALEAFHKTGETPADIHQRLAAIDEAALVAQGAPGWALDELYSDIVVGRNCCIAYYDWLGSEGPYDGYLIEPEVTLEAPILGGRAILIGKVDLKLTRASDGWIAVDDFKTASVSSRTNVMANLEKSYQHYVYQLLMALNFPGTVISEALYTVIWKMKNPARASYPLVERIRVPGLASALPIKKAQIEEIVSDMLEFLNRHGSSDLDPRAYPTPADSCRWCDMRLPCGLADENPAGAVALLTTEYRHGPRHARYAPGEE
jgi:PD-(D/E)XK nuclease superfamily